LIELTYDERWLLLVSHTLDTDMKEFRIGVNHLPQWPFAELSNIPLCPYESAVEELRLF
jgi:hypothetical protein